VENSFASPLAEPLSTFSIDVDTASYANVRRMLNNGWLPPAGAVRIEEMLNYFSYNYAPPADKGAPFAAHIAAASAPWAPEHQIVRIALKGYEVPWEERPASNLVFLVDVSGSMSSPDKLPLVKEGLRMLVGRLDARDSVAIVTYAGYEELALPSTTANNRETILHAIDRLGAGGSTNGAGGISMAYEQAKEHYLEKGLNRVILCTDGDFNVGVTSRSDLVDLITEEAKSGVFLSIFSFGTGNLQDSTMEQLADKGNGNYGYVDSESEARRVFVRNVSGNLITIAKDVKIQVEFNPAYVQAYRLIGYENRKLEAQDFNDDRKDAGEIGAGHSVTALYEVIPVGAKWEEPASVDALKYQKNPQDKAFPRLPRTRC
jgi:secreted protein with Ig-like and vWFA domain